MILPVEIIENILRKCDGKTLLSARKVDEEWKHIVDYLTQKTRIWEWCCKEEIPKNQLIEYLQSYQDEAGDKWLHIYINWYSWESIDQVMCDIVLSPVEVPRISCIAVSGNYIAVGSQDGRLRIFSNDWKMLYAARILAVKINSLTFMDSGNGESLDFCLVVSYNKGLDIFCFDGISKNQLVIQDVKSHSIYKNYICYEKVGGRMTIAKLTNTDGRRQLTEVWFSRIYSPSSLSCMKMWEGVCTFLVNNEVKIIEYESAEITPMDIMKKKTRIKFNFPLVDSQNTQILRNDVIISLCKNDDDVKSDFIEFFILGKNDKYSKKMFNTWEIFRCYITCIYLYGNTLILGVDVGTVYIYHVSCWKNLDIREYSHKLIIGKHPIICIDVKETPTERKFYVSSKFNIHEISGFLPNIY
ncbi:uncharacterized protein LOC108905436 [Anoplophora glabripennis]|uniref:uncharacterized protein LOC108905436 n=1 Tax=Anoplophora glabripennis TaxID=217634 RepID=UPI00087479AC|nr:uncharacterized protein LOC108905436 [Anoplophora glabripennis]